MKRSICVASSLAALAALAAPVLAQADTVAPGWSYANAAVGLCSAPLPGPGCTAAHPPVYPHIQIDQGFNHNAFVTDNDPTIGTSTASANVGPSSFGASFLTPQLHAFAGGGRSAGGLPYSWNYGFTEAVQGYLWNGPDTVIPLSTFAGTLDYTSNEQTFGQVDASFALLTDAADGHGDIWSATNNGQFTTSCASPGAGGIATTGNVATGTGLKTNVLLTPTQKCSGTFELQTGHTFYIWSQLQVFSLGSGSVDANNTFKVDFAANADPALRALIIQDSTIVPVDALQVSVPEPATWALMILGLGAVGGALRRSRRTATALAA